MKCKEATSRYIGSLIARCVFGIGFRMPIEFGLIWSSCHVNLT